MCVGKFEFYSFHVHTFRTLHIVIFLCKVFLNEINIDCSIILKQISQSNRYTTKNNIGTS
jgi:hypothetical protein